MKSDTVLIIGANGNVGSTLAGLLKNKGYNLRLASSKAPKSDEYVQVDLTQSKSIDDLFSGVDRAFLLSPPGYADQYSVLSPLIAAAKKHSLKKVVLMTALGANAVETAPFRRAEIELENSGVNYNIIRPNWFFQNFHSFWLGDILNEQKILLPAGTAKVGFIDARDIAEVAAKLITASNFDNQAFDITGPQTLDHAQVAQAISKVSGKQISYQDVAPEVLQGKLLKAGLPSDYVEFLLMILSYLKAGYSDTTNDNVKIITGKTPRDITAYTSDFKDAWI